MPVIWVLQWKARPRPAPLEGALGLALGAAPVADPPNDWEGQNAESNTYSPTSRSDKSDEDGGITNTQSLSNAEPEPADNVDDSEDTNYNRDTRAGTPPGRGTQGQGQNVGQDLNNITPSHTGRSSLSSNGGSCGFYPAADPAAADSAAGAAAAVAKGSEVTAFSEWERNEYRLRAVSEQVGGFRLSPHSGYLVSKEDVRQLAPLLTDAIRLLAVLDPAVLCAVSRVGRKPLGAAVSHDGVSVGGGEWEYVQYAELEAFLLACRRERLERAEAEIDPHKVMPLGVYARNRG